MSFAAGTTVRVKSGDPDHHTRVPRYVRGHTGVIVAAIDRWPLPDDSARGIDPPREETCYVVRFSAGDLAVHERFAGQRRPDGRPRLDRPAVPRPAAVRR